MLDGQCRQWFCRSGTAFEVYPLQYPRIRTTSVQGQLEWVAMDQRVVRACTVISGSGARSILPLTFFGRCRYVRSGDYNYDKRGGSFSYRGDFRSHLSIGAVDVM